MVVGKTHVLLVFWFFIFLFYVAGQSIRAQSNTTYSNPIIPLDYSDPDVCRNGDDYFLIASSFQCIPAIPVLHSRDLIHWRLINHVSDRLEPAAHFSIPQHGNGVWAPSIRHQEDWYYVFYGDPDFGIFMSKTKDPFGNWSTPVCIRQAKGWIDPCPFWDTDGQAYLIHAFAGSRTGIKSVLVLHKMAPDGSALLDDGILIFDGHDQHPTIEGPKLYSRDGYYYIFAPAGGVATGWQTVLRSRNIFGPYESRIVMAQGTTDINGPHQGGWIEGPEGEDWFIHFQEKQPFGRIVHLQPLNWRDGWPVIGEDPDGDGTGQPVASWRRPASRYTDQSGEWCGNDEFNTLEMQAFWQWHGNPKAEWAFNRPEGLLRMNPVIDNQSRNLWETPNLLLQKLPARAFSYRTRLTAQFHADGERAGLIVMGNDYAWIGPEQVDGKLFVCQRVCKDADKGQPETLIERKPIPSGELELQVDVDEKGHCFFHYSTDGMRFHPLGSSFQAKEGKWIGAKIGFFCIRDTHQNDGGFIDIDWFRIIDDEKTR